MVLRQTKVKKGRLNSWHHFLKTGNFIKMLHSLYHKIFRQTKEMNIYLTARPGSPPIGGKSLTLAKLKTGAGLF